ncbi:MAG: DNA polymerase IV [Ruminococcaceae bacterium]|nr:DNA polymerase IV [Oscillospiraceae bacterium]
MERKILHVDCNKFYASVECSRRPELRDKPVAVGGDEAARHGIVLTKNEIASRYGLVTGEPLWSARQKCPGLVVVPPDFPTYSRYSGMVRDILAQYTDRVEPFGLDEAWLDLTGCAGEAEDTAHTIRCRIKEELGITVSVGVSFNKTFAKLGSDYKKPDAVTVFSRENYRQLVWPLPVQDMLYVGRSTAQKLQSRYLYTIGDVACASPALLSALLGKWGPMLHAMANGRDRQPVIPIDQAAGVQSVSNGMTTPRDVTDEQEAHVVLCVLAESVGRRLREQHLVGKTVELQVRDNTLVTHGYRMTLDHYIQSTEDILREGLALLRQKHHWGKPLRSLTLGVSGLESDTMPCQLDMLDSTDREKRETLDKTVDALKKRFGDSCVRRAVVLEDPELAGLSLYETHTVHPTGFSGKVEP